MFKKIGKGLITFSNKIKNWKKVKISSGCTVLGNCVFEGNNYLANNVYLSNSSIGYSSYIGNDSTLVNVSIGKYCSIADHVDAVCSTHPSSGFVSSHPAFYSTTHLCKAHVTVNKFEEALKTSEGRTVKIGNDVWIGSHVLIMGGVTIHDGAIVGAGAVVTKDVEPYSIVVGIPAKVIKYRFDKNEIEYLKQIKWWDWDLEKISQNADCFEDIKKFINRG